MSKDLTFRVELTFNSKIESDEELMEIAENIGRAIKSECLNGERGISPENGDNYLEIIRVTPNYLNKTVIDHID